MNNKYGIHTKYISGGSYWSGWYEDIKKFNQELLEVIKDDDLSNDLIVIETDVYKYKPEEN